MHKIMSKTTKFSRADIYHIQQRFAICSKNHAKLQSISSDSFRIFFFFFAMTDRINIYQRNLQVNIYFIPTYKKQLLYVSAYFFKNLYEYIFETRMTHIRFQVNKFAWSQDLCCNNIALFDFFISIFWSYIVHVHYCSIFISILINWILT